MEVKQSSHTAVTVVVTKIDVRFRCILAWDMSANRLFRPVPAGAGIVKTREFWPKDDPIAVLGVKFVYEKDSNQNMDNWPVVHQRDNIRLTVDSHEQLSSAALRDLYSRMRTFACSSLLEAFDHQTQPHVDGSIIAPLEATCRSIALLKDASFSIYHSHSGSKQGPRLRCNLTVGPDSADQLPVASIRLREHGRSFTQRSPQLVIVGFARPTEHHCHYRLMFDEWLSIDDLAGLGTEPVNASLLAMHADVFDLRTQDDSARDSSNSSDNYLVDSAPPSYILSRFCECLESELMKQHLRLTGLEEKASLPHLVRSLRIWSQWSSSTPSSEQVRQFRTELDKPHGFVVLPFLQQRCVLFVRKDSTASGGDDQCLVSMIDFYKTAYSRTTARITRQPLPDVMLKQYQSVPVGTVVVPTDRFTDTIFDYMKFLQSPIAGDAAGLGWLVSDPQGVFEWLVATLQEQEGQRLATTVDLSSEGLWKTVRNPKHRGAAWQSLKYVLHFALRCVFGLDGSHYKAIMATFLTWTIDGLSTAERNERLACLSQSALSGWTDTDVQSYSHTADQRMAMLAKLSSKMTKLSSSHKDQLGLAAFAQSVIAITVKVTRYLTEYRDACLQAQSTAFTLPPIPKRVSQLAFPLTGVKEYSTQPPAALADTAAQDSGAIVLPPKDSPVLDVCDWVKGFGDSGSNRFLVASVIESTLMGIADSGSFDGWLGGSSADDACTRLTVLVHTYHELLAPGQPNLDGVGPEQRSRCVLVTLTSAVMVFSVGLRQPKLSQVLCDFRMAFEGDLLRYLVVDRDGMLWASQLQQYLAQFQDKDPLFDFAQFQHTKRFISRYFPKDDSLPTLLLAELADADKRQKKWRESERERGKRIREAEERAAAMPVDSIGRKHLEDWIYRLKITATEPETLPLPLDTPAAQCVLFFVHIPPLLRSLCDLICNTRLLFTRTPTTRPASRITKRCSWLEHYQRHSHLKSPASSGSIRLDSTSWVNDTSHDGLVYQQGNTVLLYQTQGAPRDPFRDAVDPALFQFNPELKQLRFLIGLANRPDENLGKNENDVIASQNDTPDHLQRTQYVQFGFLRACPNIQLERLLRVFQEDSLPFQDHAVRCVVLQVLLQRGPMQADGELRWKQRLFLKRPPSVGGWTAAPVSDKHDAPMVTSEVGRPQATDTKEPPRKRRGRDEIDSGATWKKPKADRAHDNSQEFLQDFERVIGGAVDKLQNYPSKWWSLFLFVRMCLFFESFGRPKDFHAIRVRIAAVVRGWADSETDQAKRTALLAVVVIATSGIMDSCGDFCSARLKVAQSPSAIPAELTEALRRGVVAEVPVWERLGQEDRDRILQQLAAHYLADCQVGRWEAIGTLCYKCETKKGAVMINLLLGLITLNRCPISTLPEKILRHPLYLRTFPGQLFSVSISDDVFTSHGADIQYRFYLTVSGSLIVKRIHKGRELVLLDPGLFVSFPICLQQEFTHWLDSETGNVLFRHRVSEETQFFCDSSNVLRRSAGSVLVPCTGPDVEPLLRVLSKFDGPDHIFIFCNEDGAISKIDFRRFGFVLSHRDGLLVSDKFNGRKLSKQQQLPDTLLGFDRYLVLEDGQGNLTLLIPEGTATRCRSTRRLCTVVNDDHKLPYAFHSYHMDSMRQLATASITDRLFLAAVHLLSGCLFVDKRTEMTGKESAIGILRQCWKNSPFSAKEKCILRSILPSTKDNGWIHSAVLVGVIQYLAESSEKVGFLYPTARSDDDPDLVFPNPKLLLTGLPRASCNPRLSLTRNEVAHLFRTSHPEFESKLAPSQAKREPFGLWDRMCFSPRSCNCADLELGLFGAGDLRLSGESITIESMGNAYDKEVLWLSWYDTIWKTRNNPARLLEYRRLVRFGLASAAAQGLVKSTAFLCSLVHLSLNPSVFPKLPFPSNWVAVPSSLQWVAVEYIPDSDSRVVRDLFSKPPRQFWHDYGRRENVPPVIVKHDLEDKFRDVAFAHELQRYIIQVRGYCERNPVDSHHQSCWGPATMIESRTIPAGAFLLCGSPIDQSHIISKVEQDLRGCWEAAEDTRTDLSSEIAGVQRQIDAAVKMCDFEECVRLQAQKKSMVATLKAVPSAPLVPFPLSPWEADLTKSKMGKSLLEELKTSHDQFHASLRRPAPKLVRHDPAWFTSQNEVVTGSLAALTSDIRQFVSQVPEHLSGYVYSIARSAGVAVSPTVSELFIVYGMSGPGLKFKSGCSQLSISAFNPFLSSEDQTVLLGRVEQLLVLRTLQAKLSRLINLLQAKDLDGAVAELQTVRTWKVSDFPELLLFEVQRGLSVRPIQFEVAKAIMEVQCNPLDSGQFSKEQQLLLGRILQMNMGEGKTKVIIPWLCCFGANGKRLLRLTVLNSLLPTMYGYLHEILCGSWITRKVRTLPFSRDVKLTPDQIRLISEQVQECQSGGDILLAAPEHRLSLQLKFLEEMVREPEVSSSGSVASDMMKMSLGESKLPASESVTPKLQEFSRLFSMPTMELLDESDEILRPQYQLIYPTGTQQEVSGNEYRWITPERLFMLFHTSDTVKKCLDPSWVYCRSPEAKSAFREVRIVKHDPEGIRRLREALCDELLSSVDQFSQLKDTSEFRRFILCHPSDEDGLTLGSDTPELRKMALCARGLLSYEVLFHVLSKRHRVEYGVHRRPDGAAFNRRMAVPFRAKDSASERTEFGHADVAIALTLLSYYYDGLQQNQIELAFKLLSELNDSDAKYTYGVWRDLSKDAIEESKEEVSLGSFDRIDLADSSTQDKLFRCFRYNVECIHFYLNKCVFPEETPQFPTKLVANGWDLAHGTAVGGFSGTNDNICTLPLQLEYKAIPSLMPTNGRMLDLITNPKHGNTEYCNVGNSPDGVLERIRTGKDNIRVLIDAGALISETNEGLVRKVLKDCPTYQGAIYFHDVSSRLMALDREGRSMELESSPIAVSECFTYIDDAHSRGTDLKFAKQAKAVVTIGKGMCKDKLLQAAMRMRQLGQGQTVSFWGNGEVTQRIEPLSEHKRPTITSKELVVWALSNTIASVEAALLDWARQGYFFAARYGALLLLRQLSEPSYQHNTRQLAGFCVDEEILDLQKMYLAPVNPTAPATICDKLRSYVAGRFRQRAKGLRSEVPESIMDLLHQSITIKTRNASKTEILCAALEEECERELEKQVEEERQRELPAKVPSLPEQEWKFETIFNPDFTKSGSILPLSQVFTDTSLARKQEKLFDGAPVSVTRNFLCTVDSRLKDEYLRPADRIVCFAWPGTQKHYLLVSGWEGHHLSPLFADDRGGEAVTFRHFADVESDEVRALLKVCCGWCEPTQAETRWIRDQFGLLDAEKGADSFRALFSKGIISCTGYISRSLTPSTVQAALSTAMVDDAEADRCAQEVERLAGKRWMRANPTEAVKTIVRFRGRMNEYNRSPLQKLLEVSQMKDRT